MTGGLGHALRRNTAGARRAAFTLIELLIGLVIVAILMFFAVPNYHTFIENQKLRARAESILSGLHTSRQEAIRLNTNVSFVLTAALLVFVDTMKELPATLIVRPFDFDTLAVRVYSLAADERLAEASTAALLIVAVGLLPVVVLTRVMRNN